MKTKDSVRKSMAGADVAFERLRCAEGAVRSSCAARPDLSLRDIADPDGGVCAIREWHGLRWTLIAERSFSANKARMSMKTKDNDNMSLDPPLSSTPPPGAVDSGRARRSGMTMRSRMGRTLQADPTRWSRFPNTHPLRNTRRKAGVLASRADS